MLSFLFLGGAFASCRVAGSLRIHCHEHPPCPLLFHQGGSHVRAESAKCSRGRIARLCTARQRTSPCPRLRPDRYQHRFFQLCRDHHHQRSLGNIKVKSCYIFAEVTNSFSPVQFSSVFRFLILKYICINFPELPIALVHFEYFVIIFQQGHNSYITIAVSTQFLSTLMFFLKHFKFLDIMKVFMPFPTLNVTKI